MPEGDTLYRAAHSLQKALQGRQITVFETVYAHLQQVQDDHNLIGRTIERVTAHGKWLLLFFSGDLILATHMRMSGSWHLYHVGAPWKQPHAAMRIRLVAGTVEAVAFHVPVAVFHTAVSLARDQRIAGLGPDILSTSFTVQLGAEQLQKEARAHPQEEVANALLNQRILAGLGNVYKSEICFEAKVHPFRALETLSSEERLHLVERAQRALRNNVTDIAGSAVALQTSARRTAKGTGRETRLWVYGRQGKPCQRCGTLIAMRKQGIGARSTYWCPSCQPWIGQTEAPQGWIHPLRRKHTTC